MLKKYIDENTIEDIKKDGYLIIDKEKHLIINIQNQLIKILNENNIYEYIEEEKPLYDVETQYLDYKYKLIDDVIYKTYEIKYIEVVEDEFMEEIMG